MVHDIVCIWVTGRDVFRFGQSHIYAVYVRYFWQGNHQVSGHICCVGIYGSGQP